MFGSSRQLAVGPVAVTSLLIGSGLKKVVPGAQFVTDPNNLDTYQYDVQQRYNRSVTQLAFLVAVMYTAMGALRLGFLLRLLSHPIITGFTSGAAVIIGLSQVKYIVGYSVPRVDTLQDNIRVLVEGGKGFMWTECVMGVSMLAFLVGLRFVSQRYPKRLFWLAPLGPMIACIIGIVVVVVGKFDYAPSAAGVSPIKCILTIPRGLPKPTIQTWLPLDYPTTIVPLAFIVTLVDMLESTSIAR